MVHAFHGHTGDYLEQPGGDPTNNLLALARVGLQTSLRAAVQRAVETGREVTVDAHSQRSDGYRPVRVTVQALPRSVHGDRMVVVSFADPMPAPDQDHTAAVRPPPNDDELEAELHATREDLRLTTGQMESANEELKASNEELETSKEELQSLNEELRTVNQQLQGKVDELEERTDDMRNLLNGADVATLFLDEHLRIRWFTPAMKTLLELLPLDLGRPVDHFAQRFTNGDLVEDARQVLQTLQPVSCEVTGADQRNFLRRIIPYRTENNRIDGVVITFVDISERKEQEHEVQAAREFAESIVETIREPLLVLTPELIIRSANAAFYRTFEVKAEETEGRLIYDLGDGQWRIPALQELLERILPDNRTFSDFAVEHAFQGIGRRTMLLNGCRLDKQQLILLAIDDITHRRLAEAAIDDDG
jgi:PAS domain-containing protein